MLKAFLPLRHKQSTPSRRDLRLRFESPLSLLESRSAPTSFFFLDPLLPPGACQAIADSEIWLGTFQLASDNHELHPNGGVTSSEADAVVYWTDTGETRPPTLVPGLTAHEQGQVSTGVTVGGPGSGVQNFTIYASHNHIDTITADAAATYTYDQSREDTIAQSTTPYSLDVLGPGGTFVPGTTLSVDISVSVQQSTPGFANLFVLTINSTHFNLAANNRGDGLVITDPSTNAVIASDPNFGITDFGYHQVLTFQAQSTETVGYYSEYLTNPDGGPYWNETVGQTSSAAWTVNFALS